MSFWKDAQRLGEMSGLQEPSEIEVPRPVASNLVRPQRKNIWPADVWAEMQAIYSGEKA
jgi:hypothetical protein